jgi:hypothetical protein
LQLANHLLTVAVNLSERIVSQLSPLLLDASGSLLPLSLQNVLIQEQFLLVSCVHG